MEHVDWVVSFAIFIFIILIIILFVPRMLPETGFRGDVNTPHLIFSDLRDNVKIINLSTENPEKDIYFLEIDLNLEDKIITSNNEYIIIDDIIFSSIKKNKKIYKIRKFDDIILDPLNTMIFDEKFLNLNNLKYLEVISGDLIYFKGDAYVFENTIIETKEPYSDIFGEYIIEPSDVNIYFNYEDDNNYSLCEFKNNILSLYDVNSSGSHLIDSTSVTIDNDFWITFNFKSNFSGEVFCKIKENQVNNDSQTSINKGTIRIINENEHYLNRFILYYDNYSLNDQINNQIIIKNLIAKINDTELEIDLFKEKEKIGSLNIDVNSNLLLNESSNNVILEINNLEEFTKFLFFPRTPNFFIIVDTEDSIDFILNDGLKINYFDYKIEDDGEDVFIWIDNISINANQTKTVYLKKVAGYNESTVLKDYDEPTHPTVFVDDLGSENYKIDIENNNDFDINNYQVRVPNNIINASIGDSLFISNNFFDTENKIDLINKDKEKYLQMYFYNVKNQSTECDVDIIDNGFNISNCLEKTIIKVSLNNLLREDYKINHYKTTEQMITFQTISKNFEENYPLFYINISNEKENISFGEFSFIGDFHLFEKPSKFLNNKGKEEIVNVLIKPN